METLLTHSVNSQPSKLTDMIKEKLTDKYQENLGTEMVSSLEFLKMSISSFGNACKSLKIKQLTNMIEKTVKRFDIKELVETIASGFSQNEGVEKGIEI